MKGKNKLVPRLLGITKESVMRVDEKTKDVVQEWPLTTVKRWAASPKSFTLVSSSQTRARTPQGGVTLLRDQASAAWSQSHTSEQSCPSRGQGRVGGGGSGLVAPP